MAPLQECYHHCLHTGSCDGHISLTNSSEQSGLSYTIIHPGGLIDEPPGEKNLVLNVDDALLKEEKKSISRADVANLCVAALAVRGEQQVSFDCIARDATDGGEKVLSAEEALSKFLATGKTTDYSL